MGDMFERNVPGMTARLARCTVGVAGCGGLGSNVAVALTRAGVGRLILADPDRVELSNLNRQAFDRDDVGRLKVEALRRKLLRIHPGLKIDGHDCELTPENVPRIFALADLLVEAFDLAESKIWLIGSWTRAFPGRPIVCGNGVGGYGQTETMRVERSGRIVFCGDMESDMQLGLCSARVLMAAAMQANMAIELLMDEVS